MSHAYIGEGPEGGSYRTASGNLIDPTREAAHIETMTVGLAEWLLERNADNRRIKARKVDQWAYQFEMDRWELTSEGLGLEQCGLIADGQHRLKAWLRVVKSGMQANWKTLIVTGLSETARDKINNGAPRSLVDRIKLSRELRADAGASKIDKDLVAVVRILQGGFRVGRRKDGTEAFVAAPEESGKLDVVDVIDFLDCHGKTIDPIIKACGKMAAPIVAALCEYGLRGYSEEAAHLASQIRKGEGLTSSDPAYRIRERIMQSPVKGNGKAVKSLVGDAARVELYAKTVSACCAHARRQPLTKLYAASSWSGLPRRSDR